MELYTSPYQEERNQLVLTLTKYYPYPVNWFHDQSTSKLIAMLNSAKERN